MLRSEIGASREYGTLMDAALAVGDMDAWLVAHHAFLRCCVARADIPLGRVVDSYPERCLHIYQLWHPQSFAIAHREYEAVLESIVRRPTPRGSICRRWRPTSSPSTMPPPPSSSPATRPAS